MEAGSRANITRMPEVMAKWTSEIILNQKEERNSDRNNRRNQRSHRRREESIRKAAGDRNRLERGFAQQVFEKSLR